jgi:hypothetical protein
MSQASQTSAPPGALAPAGAPAPPSRAPSGMPAVRSRGGPATGAASTPRLRAREVARSRLEGTPGRLRIAAVVAVLASLVFGFLGGSAFRGWGGALEDARADTAQLVRIQTIQNDLVKADAAASNAYLTGGVESPAVRASYDQAIAEAARLLAEPSAAAEDTVTLRSAVTGLARYTGLVEQARANNRQGMQVGAAYLRQAGTVLRTQIVPALETVSQADQRRVAAAYDRANRATATYVLAAGLALAALILVQLWLARRTRRVINLPLAVATLAVLVGLGGGLFTLQRAATTAGGAADRPYGATVALASARTAAFDAKAQESLGLIARGNAGPSQEVANARIKQAEQQLELAESRGVPDASRRAFAAWKTQHTAVRAADDGGNWSGARTAATGASNTAFTEFDTVSLLELRTQAGQVDSALGRPYLSLLVVGWLVLALGLLAAVSALTGILQRLGEYR